MNQNSEIKFLKKPQPPEENDGRQQNREVSHCRTDKKEGNIDAYNSHPVINICQVV